MARQTAIMAFGSTLARPMNYEDARARLDTIEQSQVEGIVQIAVVRSHHPGVHNVEAISDGGLDTYRMLLALKIVSQRIETVYGTRHPDKIELDADALHEVAQRIVVHVRPRWRQLIDQWLGRRAGLSWREFEAVAAVSRAIAVASGLSPTRNPRLLEPAE